MMGRLVALLLLPLLVAVPSGATTYYVRQTVGNDTNDGTSPKTAWEHFGKLGHAMHAGDTAYVGPGLYRDGITVSNDGTADKRIVFIADPTGKHTGDPPGVVMITGAEPVDESIFVADDKPGLFHADFPAFVVQGVVEMDGDQSRYLRVTTTAEYLTDKMNPVDIVAKMPKSYYYDPDGKVLHIHTSDDKHPKTHELELFQRMNGIGMQQRHFVTVIGFTFRHFGDAGVSFFQETTNGTAIGNTSYGSRQGIRVYGATNVTVYGNTLFRNENCGVYFAAASLNGSAVGNVCYENIKGVRWSSKSVNGIAIDNALFDNRERGLSVEDTAGVVGLNNKLVNNKMSQILVIPPSVVDFENDCFETGDPKQLTADFFYRDRYATLEEYQDAQHQDRHSHAGDCGALPAKLDVHKLHAETQAYTAAARKKLGIAPSGGGVHQ